MSAPASAAASTGHVCQETLANIATVARAARSSHSPSESCYVVDMNEEAQDGFLEELIDELRANEGRMLRRLLIRLRLADHPEAKALFHTLITHPDLRDLVPH